MSNLFIVLDVSNLAYRALHTVGDLTHPDDPDRFTGVYYQLWQTAVQLQQIYRTYNLAFAFDSRKSLRQDAYLPYKQKRKCERQAKEAADPEALRRRVGMHKQIDGLPSLLHEIGAKNIFGQTGYEADDMIASIVINNPNFNVVIVSTDADLLQLLRPGVTIYNPVKRKETTDIDFINEYGISPIQWNSVKAWTGCTSDNIGGVPGVGEVTAIKWLKGQIKQESAKYPLFTDNLNVYTRNKPLVTLPYPGTQANVLKKQASQLNWNRLASEIGSTNYVPTGILDDD
jgi:DNA polymerase-1